MVRCPLQALFAVAAGARWLFLRLPAACRVCAVRGVLAPVSPFVNCAKDVESRAKDDLSGVRPRCEVQLDAHLPARPPPNNTTGSDECWAVDSSRTRRSLRFESTVVDSSRARTSLWFERPGRARRLTESAMGSSSLSVRSMQGCVLITCRLASAACVCLLPAARRLPAACPSSPLCDAPGLVCWNQAVLPRVTTVPVTILRQKPYLGFT